MCHTYRPMSPLCVCSLKWMSVKSAIVFTYCYFILFWYHIYTINRNSALDQVCRFFMRVGIFRTVIRFMFKEYTLKGIVFNYSCVLSFVRLVCRPIHYLFISHLMKIKHSWLMEKQWRNRKECLKEHHCLLPGQFETLSGVIRKHYTVSTTSKPHHAF